MLHIAILCTCGKLTYRLHRTPTQSQAAEVFQPGGWLHKITGHTCYDPARHLVVPSFKHPNHYHRSPLLGARPVERDILLFFRGDVGKRRLPNYSRGIRQRMYKMAKELKWKVRGGEGGELGALQCGGCRESVLVIGAFRCGQGSSSCGP